MFHVTKIQKISSPRTIQGKNVVITEKQEATLTIVYSCKKSILYMELTPKQFDKIFSKNSFQINNLSFTFKYGNFMHFLEIPDYHPLAKIQGNGIILLPFFYWKLMPNHIMIYVKPSHDWWLITPSTKAERSSERHAIIAKRERIAHPYAIFVFQKVQKLLHAALNGQADKNVFSQKFHYIPHIVLFRTKNSISAVYPQ